MTTTTAAGGRTEAERERRREWKRNAARQQAYGRWQPWVDAAPVRAHVQALRAAGVGRDRIADLAGVPRSTMNGLLYGRPAIGQPPTQKMRPDTAAKLLAVRPSIGLLADDARTDATGTRRRLQALGAGGWPGVTLADRLGVNVTYISELQRRTGVVYVRTARAVASLYDDLAHLDPVEQGVAPTYALRARLNAGRCGWLPRTVWDTDIDDPAADPHQPDGGAIDTEAVQRALDGKAVRLTQVELLHAAQLMTERGDTAEHIAALFGVTSRTITRWRKANGWVWRGREVA